MTYRLPLLCTVALFVGMGTASAQSFDMKGTWTGTGKTIVNGPAGHHPASVPSKPAGSSRLTEPAFTTKIEGQDGNRVWGTLSSAAATDPVIGVISPDGKQLRLVLKGRGVIEGTIIDPDTINIFYTEAHNGVAVAATNTWKRQK